jgi:hypothetical protein
MEPTQIKEVVYIETTIVSYLVARPSRDRILAAHQEVTRHWWKEQLSRYVCLTSSEVLREAGLGDPEMVAKRLTGLSELKTVLIDEPTQNQAKLLLETGLFPPEAWSDVLHLAAAMQAPADYLLTWNCKHLANAHIIRQLERKTAAWSGNLPTVCTPLELMAT